MSSAIPPLDDWDRNTHLHAVDQDDAPAKYANYPGSFRADRDTRATALIACGSFCMVGIIGILTIVARNWTVMAYWAGKFLHGQ